MGAPGVGKGTQAQRLMELWTIPQISTGDLIRDNIRQGTAIGRRFKELVDAGIYVPDDVVNDMVADRTAQPDCQRGFILDGYPRTLGQAEWLDGFLAGWASTEAQAPKLPLVAVSVQVGYDELLRRVTGRRVGPVSKRIYNIYTNPPVSPGVCDVDGEPLVQRPDDTEEVFAERMRVFGEQTAPVIEHYRDLGRFEEVDGEQAVEAVTEQIAATLRRLRNR
ncbi:MAG: adenylate kinase [Terriglobus roseus]|nr:adenylate kinase [Terriglobus roseus]